ncbi:MAG: hypothetical protein JWM84_3906 [Nocardioides sp.]|nr:hypothetical protein [Nocardioides sp.]
MTQEAVSSTLQRPLRVGQFTGWHGDRPDGMAELLHSGVDILTGDYLAELTMLVLQKNRERGGVGYVDAFLQALEPHLAEIARRGVKVVTNAGGLDAAGLAEALRAMCTEQGVELSVAAVVGDDVRAELARGEVPALVNIDTGEPLDLAEHKVLTANAYLGAWPIVEALRLGADIVVCPRTTDASLVVGPAAWYFGWAPEDFNRLAGAVVAGHVIECGAQATGGNYSFFTEHEDLGLPGMPIAEIDGDGSAVITKSEGSGGLVTTDTVLAQLFYEVGGPAYQNPDVVTDLSSVSVAQVGTNRVSVSGTSGFPPTPTAKLSLTFEGGYRNSMTIGLTGGNLHEKRAWVQRQVELEIGGPASFDECRWSMVGPADPQGTFEEATAWLVVTVRDQDRQRVSRSGFSNRIVAIATSNIPGFYMTSPPQAERLFAVQWPTLIDKALVRPSVLLGAGAPVAVPWPVAGRAVETYPTAGLRCAPPADSAGTATARRAIGTLIGTRSGDKAGSVNLGAWARDEPAHAWLTEFLTVRCLRALMPELEGLRVERHLFPNLRGMNFVIYQYLGAGVSACTRIDPQGKGLGEYLASRVVDIPVRLLGTTEPVG